MRGAILPTHARQLTIVPSHLPFHQSKIGIDRYSLQLGHSAARAGDEIVARAKVTANYEKKGHRFVELDALVVANGTTPLAHCQHTAIYQPREQAAA